MIFSRSYHSLRSFGCKVTTIIFLFYNTDVTKA